MSLDKRNLPPQIQSLLDALEKAGIKPQILTEEELPPELKAKISETSSTPSDDGVCDCPVCKTLPPEQRTRIPRSATGPSFGSIPPGLLAHLDRTADRMAQMLVERVRGLVDPLREIIDNNMAKIADLESRVEKYRALAQAAQASYTDLQSRHVGLVSRVSSAETQLTDLNQRHIDLAERHRKQTGLLHKRVTKRKGEVADVKVRVATTRGRVTRVEKKLT